MDSQWMDRNLSGFIKNIFICFKQKSYKFGTTLTDDRILEVFFFCFHLVLFGKISSRQNSYAYTLYFIG